jgi:spore coat protein U-like protein
MNAWTSIDVTLGGGRRNRRRGALVRGLLFLLVVGTATHALAVPTCTIASGATLSFGSVVALASTGDVSANSGSSLWVNCTGDVATTPRFYSPTTRTLVSGGNNLAFSLSASAPGGVELATFSPGTPLGIAKNGSNQTVTLYGKIYNANFRALPSGSYSRVIDLTVEY